VRDNAATVAWTVALAAAAGTAAYLLWKRRAARL
jgi:hypothetical protein